MSVEQEPRRLPARPTPEEREQLKQISAAVARAARHLIRWRRTSIPLSDLEALGMLNVWRKLDEFDPARATFDDWAFYQAQHAMWDAARSEQRETTLAADLRTGVRGHAAQDDRPPESDFHNDTAETDHRRLRLRTRAMAVSAVVEATNERGRESAALEQELEVAEEVLALRADIASFSEEDRMYLRLRFWDDQEVQAVAERLGIPERTLRRRWALVRERLLGRLERRGVYGVPEGFSRVADALAAAEGEEAGEPASKGKPR